MGGIRIAAEPTQMNRPPMSQEQLEENMQLLKADTAREGFGQPRSPMIDGGEKLYKLDAVPDLPSRVEEEVGEDFYAINMNLATTHLDKWELGHIDWKFEDAVLQAMNNTRRSKYTKERSRELAMIEIIGYTHTRKSKEGFLANKQREQIRTLQSGFNSGGGGGVVLPKRRGFMDRIFG